MPEPANWIDRREALGLSEADLGRGLKIGDSDPGETIRAYESGKTEIPRPVEAALILHDQASGAWDTVERLIH